MYSLYIDAIFAVFLEIVFVEVLQGHFQDEVRRWAESTMEWLLCGRFTETD
jgi:hypothetical protein